ncbi:hypothetical protein HD806DRAFT_507670 [Xylariaceae sp. AK1471]|nr:hypothetical protein HD806DRAFT_507670 [Xylariaceae sp. AK1471]
MTPDLSTYDHTHWKTRDPVRSPIDKPVRAKLVVGSVTTSESLVLEQVSQRVVQEIMQRVPCTKMHQLLLNSVADIPVFSRQVPLSLELLFPATQKSRIKSTTAGWEGESSGTRCWDHMNLQSSGALP